MVQSKPAEKPYVVMFSAFHILSATTSGGGRQGGGGEGEEEEEEGRERIQECWGFDHPRPDVVVDQNGTFPSFLPSFPSSSINSKKRKDETNKIGKIGLPFTNQHNARSTHLTFHIPQAGVCHGFAGYFEAVLYGSVGLSLHPERSGGEMLSWFPIFFPLQVSIFHLLLLLLCSSFCSFSFSKKEL